MGKKCLFCGRFFVPDFRVGERQKAYGREACKKARKRLAQRNWCGKNPGYFQGRYPYVKEWREKKRASSGITGLSMIQDKIPPAQPLQRLILLLPRGWGQAIVIRYFLAGKGDGEKGTVFTSLSSGQGRSVLPPPSAKRRQAYPKFSHHKNYRRHMKEGDRLLLKVPQAIIARKLRRGAGFIARRGTGHLRRWKALFLLNAVSKSY